jgi:predicted metal-dependent phosphoesterase TrpH
LIDLHTHTTASDGSFEPSELIQAAVEADLKAIAITDHDTFAGYEQAMPHAQKAGIELVCGIELSTKMAVPGKPRGRSIHLLGYFPKSEPAKEFLDWIDQLAASRRDRNRRLAARLQELNVDITIEEVQSRGRNMAGRPHFAQLLLEKGYVETLQQAFDRYLDEKAEAYVERDEPMLGEGIRRILDSGGVPSLAHPIRLGKRRPGEEEDTIRQMAKMGLPAIEAYHSDHSERDVERYQFIARRYGLAVTGGSDFHGTNKPGILVGSGRDGNVQVPSKVLDRLKQLVKN